MTHLFILALIVGAIVVFVEITRGGKSEAKKYRYEQKTFFMTRAEHECFDALVKAVGEKYHVFAQVHLPSIVSNKVVGQNWKGAFKHISQKSVDFVLCDKAYLAPKLAIELDDKIHERADRIERDGEVERILEEAGLPLLRLENHGHFDPAELGRLVSEALENKAK